MDRLTITQRIKIIKTFYKNCHSVTATYRALRGDYGEGDIRKTKQVIGKIVKKFEETGVATNIKRLVHHRLARSAENIVIVSESVAEDPNVSIPRRSQELELFYRTLWRILHLNLHLHPYKFHHMQQQKPADYSQRCKYVE